MKVTEKFFIIKFVEHPLMPVSGLIPKFPPVFPASPMQTRMAVMSQLHEVADQGPKMDRYKLTGPSASN